MVTLLNNRGQNGSPGRPAASLLLAGTTAADLLHTSGARQDETVLLNGPAGAVGVSVLQQARILGARVIGASNPANGPFRARPRSRILKLAQDGDLVVPMAQTFRFADAPAAFAALTSPHPPGKLALVNDQ